MKNIFKTQDLKSLLANPSALACFVGCFVIISAFAAGTGLLLPRIVSGQSYNKEESNHGTAPTLNPRTAGSSFADIVENAGPSVVTVRVDVKSKSGSAANLPFMNDPAFRQFFGDKLPQMKAEPRTQHSLGSGVVVRSDGTILTNNHVVQGAEKITVEFSDRSSFVAKVVGTDPLSDLAVIKIDAKDLKALTLGDSDKVRVGDVVLAIGNPLGLRQTVTSGIISAKGRQTGLSDGSFEDFLQTDAPINQGNSGGALIDVNGELIGINSQILSPSGGSIGIGFAIPSNMAKSVMEQLLKNGKVHRGMLGVGIQDLSPDLAENFGLKDINGVLINSVKEGGPAAKAGIQQGDVVTAMNDQKISNTNEFRNKVANLAPGTDIKLGIIRGGKNQLINAKLTELSTDQTENGNPNESAPSVSGGKLGITVEPLTPSIATQLGLRNKTGGLVITDIQSGSKAEDAGLQQGDVILQINRQPVNSVGEVEALLSKSGTKSVLLLIDRHNQTVYVTV